MYQEWMDTVPLLLSGTADYIRENNRRELARCARYYDNKGDKEEAERYRELANRY